MQGGLDLDLMPQSLAVCRLQPNDGIPTWIQKSDFFSVTRSNDELSIVCTDVGIPDSVRSEKGWRCLKVKGPLDFSLTGVLASLVTPLSTAKVSIFTISTFDTDYLLIKNNDLENARLTLSNAGHRIDDSKK
ncbi:MAG: ACT domain-containing protein [Bdellovibrionaceae bacterium]|nr:ACT domain-containing protein [Bdellovibrio sp.]